MATIGFTQFQHSFDESGETFVAIEVLQGSLEAEVTVIVSSDDGTAQGEQGGVELVVSTP